LSQKDQAADSTKLIKEKLKPESVNFIKEEIDDPLTDYKNHLKKLSDTAKEYNLPLELIKTETTTLDGKFNVNTEKSL
jgi:hypothetical protein